MVFTTGNWEADQRGAELSGKIITVAQQKGGAGKTTLVAQLAVALATKGQRIALVDIDPQASLSTWFQIREENKNTENLWLSGLTAWRTQSADKLTAENDLVLIDAPPHSQTEAQSAVRAADLVLVPIQPSPVDLWATEPILSLARSERRPTLLVLNRASSRVKLAEELAEPISDLGADVAKATLGNRVAFASSMFEGAGVVETAPSSKAAQEIRALAKEITRRLSRG